MTISGHVHNGVIVLDEGASFPEGTRVCVFTLPVQQSKPQIECIPGQLPLVRGGLSGSLELTNERIAEILDTEDLEALRKHSP